MDQIKEKISELKSLISSNLENLKPFTCSDIDELLNYQSYFIKQNWKDKLNHEKAIRLRYIQELSTHEDKIKALLHWKMEMTKESVTIQDDKKAIISYLIEEGKKENSDFYNKNYDMLWDLICNGIIHFDNLEFIELLTIPFLTYVSKKHIFKKQKKDSESEEEEEEKNIIMTNGERFWVNVLRVFHDQEGFDTTQALKALCENVNPKLNFFPMKVTVLEGDLIPQITDHYKTRSNYISPLIDMRRNIGIILNNMNSSFYDYNELMSKNGFFTNQIAIEFPYMCYGWIDSIELDIDNYMVKETLKKTLKFNHGKDYILRSFNKVPEEKVSYLNANFETYTAKKENDGPGYYVSVYLDFKTFYKIVGLRLFGKVITFV